MGWPENGSGVGGGVVQNILFANITAAPNLALGNVVIFGDLTGNAVTPTPTGGVVGTKYTFIWHQDATGGRNVTFDGVDYGSGAANTHMVKDYVCVATNTLFLVGSS